MNKEQLKEILSLISRDNTSKILNNEANLIGLNYIDPYLREDKSMVFDTKTPMSARLALGCGLVLPLYKEKPEFTNDMVSHWVTKMSSWNKVRRDHFVEFMQNGAVPVYLDVQSGLIGMASDEAIAKIEAMFFSFIVERLKWLFKSTWRYGSSVSKDWEKSCNLVANSILNLVRSYGGVDIGSERLTACGHANISCFNTHTSMRKQLLFSKTLTLPSIFGEGFYIEITSHRVSVSYAGSKLRKWWKLLGNNYNAVREEGVGDWTGYTILDHINGGGTYHKIYDNEKGSINFSHKYIRDPVVIADPKKPTAADFQGNRCFPKKVIGWSLPPSSSVQALGLGIVTSYNLDCCRIFCRGAANQAVVDMDVLVRQQYSEKGEAYPGGADPLGWSMVASRRKPEMGANLEATTAYRVCKRLEQTKQFLDMEYAKGLQFGQMHTKHREFLAAGLRQMVMLPLNPYMTPLEGVVHPFTLVADRNRDTGNITFYFSDGGEAIGLDDQDMLREWITAFNDGAICSYQISFGVSVNESEGLDKVAAVVGMKISHEAKQEKPELCKEIMEFYDAMDRWHCLFYMDILGVGLDSHQAFSSNEAKLATSSGLDMAMELLIESILRWGLFDKNQRTANERDISRPQ